MKLIFKDSDSIYKINRTIEKISTKRKIYITIHKDNAIFENIWFGKQLLELINSKNLEYEFIVADLKSQKYFEIIGADFSIKKDQLALRMFKSFYNFFLKARKYHVDIIKRQSYISYFVILFEIILIFYVFYFFYSLISPSVTIYVKSNYSFEEMVYNFRYVPENNQQYFDDYNFLTVPYMSGSSQQSYIIQVDVENIRYLQKPASGKIKLYNKTYDSVSLVANTKFVTDNGIVFRGVNWVNIPPADENGPGIADVEVEAMELDDNDELIGIRGNLTEGTTLYVQNLTASILKQDIYAQVEKDFFGGETIEEGVVKQSDIDILSNKLITYLRENKNYLLLENEKLDGQIILPFDDLISLRGYDVQFSAKPGDNVSKVEGKISFILDYKYINIENLKEVIIKYVQERSSENLKLIDIDEKSFLLLEKYDCHKYFDRYYGGCPNDFEEVLIMPTSFDVIWGYDFNKDVNGLKLDIKSKILGKKVNEAKKIILDFPEIDVAVIKLSPPWYDFIPNLNSRIKIIVEN